MLQSSSSVACTWLTMRGRSPLEARIADTLVPTSPDPITPTSTDEGSTPLNGSASGAGFIAVSAAG